MKANCMKDIGVVRIPCLFVIACSFVILICGCMDRKSDYALANEISLSSDDVLALVRSVVMKQGQRLSDEEKEIILQSAPKLAQYRMAETFGQYLWSWNLPTGRTIEVKYTGDLKPMIDTEKMIVVFLNK